MNRIVEKRQLSENVFGMTIEAPLIASERKAGQFIILMVDEEAGDRKVFSTATIIRLCRSGTSRRRPS